MDRIYLKVREGFEQSGVALKDFLASKNIDADLLSEQELIRNGHHYKNGYNVGEVHCVNTKVFKKDEESRFLGTMYFGDFSVEKLKEINDLSNEQEVKNLHIFSSIPTWRTHMFIGTIKYEELGDLAQLYNNFIWLENDPKWIYMSLVYSGCKPIIEHNIPVVTVEEYAKEIGLV